jgi:hypothetical protein
MAVLPFGARHADARTNLDTLARPRLLKNAKLHSELTEGFRRSGGTAIPIDHTRLEKLFEMIATGLLWHHWNVLLETGHSATAAIFSSAGEFSFSQIFYSWKTPLRVSGNLGNGTFCYEGAQATDSPQSSIWRFSMYGGIFFGGDRKVPGPASLAVAVTGTNALIEKLRIGIFAAT